MLDKLVAGFLTSYLGEYFEGIDTEQVNISLWNGHVELKNMKVRTDALRNWDTPLYVREGTIADMRVSIPWRQLQSESVVIVLNRVALVVEQKTSDNYNVEKQLDEAQMRKQRDLDAFEEVLLAAWSAERTKGAVLSSPVVACSGKDHADDSDTFSTRLKAMMLNNVKIEIHGLELQYQRHVDPGLSSAAGSSTTTQRLTLHVNQLLSFPCNEFYEPSFTRAARVKLMHKVLNIGGIRVSMEEHSDGSHIHSGNSVSPFDAFVKVRFQPVPFDTDISTGFLAVRVEDMKATLTADQLRTVLHIAQEVLQREKQQGQEVYWRQGRPLTTPTQDPAAWWRYACRAVQLQSRRKTAHAAFSWPQHQAMKKNRMEYARLYLRSRREVLGASPWLDALGEEEVACMKTLESILPVETLNLARRMGLEQIEMERQEFERASKCVAKGDQAPPPHPDSQQHAPVRPRRGGFWKGWLSKPDGKKALEAVSTEERAAIQEMVSLISTRQWSEAQRRVIAKEFGISDEEAHEMATPRRRSGGQSHAPTYECLLQFTSCEVNLCNPSQQKGFAVLHVRGWSIGATVNKDSDADAVRVWMAVQSYGISSASKQRGDNQSPVIEVSSGYAGNDVSLLDVKTEMDVVMGQLLLKVHPSFHEIGKRQKQQAMCFVELENSRISPALLGNAQKVDPYDVSISLSPVDVHVEESILDPFVSFLLSVIEEEWPGQEASRSLEVFQEAEAERVSSSRKRHAPLDEKAKLGLLMRAVERGWLGSWHLSCREVTFYLFAELEKEKMGSRVRLSDVTLSDNVNHKMERRRRFMSAAASPSVPSASLGAAADDWVDKFDGTVSKFSVSCLLPRSHGGGRELPGTVTTWSDVLSPVVVDIHVKKSLLAHRQPLYPHFSVDVSCRSALQMTATRNHLATLCSSGTFLVDYVATVKRKIIQSQQRNYSNAVTQSGGISQLFEVCSVQIDSAFLCENDIDNAPSPTAGGTKAGPIGVSRGALVCFYPHRPTYPQQYYELYEGHFHIRRHPVDPCTMELYVEQGGAPHNTSRNGLKAARKLLSETLKLTHVPENITLLRSVVDDWRQRNHQVSGSSCAVVTEQLQIDVEAALRTLEKAAHTTPCHRLTLTCATPADLAALEQAIQDNATEHPLFSVADATTTCAFDEQGDDTMLLFRLGIGARACTLELRGDEEGNKHHTTISLGGVHLDVEQLASRKRLNLRTRTLLVNGTGGTAEHGKEEQEEEVLLSVGYNNTSMAPQEVHSVAVCAEIHSRHNKPMPSYVRTTVDVNPTSRITCHLSDGLVCTLETLWDYVGIVNSLLFGHSVAQCTPWVVDTHVAQNEGCLSTRRKEEEEWLSHPCFGALKKHDIHLSVTSSFDLLVHLPARPDDLQDIANLSKPICRLTGEAISVDVGISTGKTDVKLSLLQPTLAMDVGAQEMVVMATGSSDDAAAVSLHYNSTSSSPTVSLADRLWSTRSQFSPEQTAIGYCFTQHLDVGIKSMHLVFWFPHLVTLLDILSKGLMSRIADVNHRKQVLSHSGWPSLEVARPLDAAVLWTMMEKRVRLEHVQIHLPAARNDVLLVNLRQAQQPDSGLFADIEKVTFRDMFDQGACASGGHVKADVKHKNSLEFSGVRIVSKKNRSVSHAIVDGLHVTFDFAKSLFSVEPSVRSIKDFCVMLPQPVVARGDVNDYMALMKWLDGNFVHAQALPPLFVSGTHPVEDPFLAYCYGDCSADMLDKWSVSAPSICVRMQSRGDRSDLSFDNVAVIHGAQVKLDWNRSLGSFDIDFHAESASMWNLSHLGRDGIEGLFTKHPSEVADDMYAYIKLNGCTEKGEDANGGNDKVQITFAYGPDVLDIKEKDNNSMALRVSMDTLELALVPRFLLELRDSFLSLAMRNCLGALLNWDPYVANSQQHMVASGRAKKKNSSFSTEISLGRVRVTVPYICPNKGLMMPLLFVGLSGVSFSSHQAADHSSLTYVVQRLGSSGTYDAQRNSGGGSASPEEGTCYRPLLEEISFCRPQHKKVDLLDSLFHQEKDPGIASSERKGEKEPWMLLKLSTEKGVLASLMPTCLLVPSHREMSVVQSVFAEGGFQALGLLGMYREERQQTMLPLVKRAAEESLSWVQRALHKRLQCTMHSPTVMLSEEAAVTSVRGIKEGLIVSCSEILLSDRGDGSNNSEQAFVISDIFVSSVASLHHTFVDEFSVTCSRRTSPQKKSAYKYSVSTTTIKSCIELSYYEVLWRSIAISYLPLWQNAVQQHSKSSLHHHFFGDKEFQLPCHREGKDESVWCDSSAVQAPASQDHDVDILLGGVQLRVQSKGVSVYFILEPISGQVHISMKPKAATSESDEIMLDVCLATAGMKIGVKETSPLLWCQPVTQILNETVRDRMASRQETHGKIALLISSVHGEEVVTANIGRVMVNLDAGDIVPALALLYKPYAQAMFMGDYQLREVKTFDCDSALSSDLVLNSRTQLRISNSRFNHITLNAAGHRIDFHECGEALLLLDEGLVFRIVNATIYLHGHSIDHYLQAGNGSYVIVDRTSNTVVEAPAASEEEERAGGVEEEGGVANETLSISSSQPPHKQREKAQTRRIVAHGQLTVELPEPPATAASSPAPQRLVLGTLISCSMEDVLHPSSITPERSATLDVSDISLSRDARKGKGKLDDGPNADRVDLISNWALQILYSQAGTHRQHSGSSHSRHVSVVASRGTDIYLRYSDFLLCRNAFTQAQASLKLALGNIDVNAFTQLFRTGGSKPSSSTTTTEFRTSAMVDLRSINIYVVNDGSGSTDYPLFHLNKMGINTPNGILTRTGGSWDINFSIAISYYDWAISAWQPFIDSVSVTAQWSYELNSTMDDILSRKGFQHCTVTSENIKAYISPALLLCVYKLMQLQRQLMDYEATTTAVATSGGEVHHAFKVCQYISDASVVIDFAQDDLKRFPEETLLSFGQSFTFNFPRIDGKDLPQSQQAILIYAHDSTQVVNIASRGRYRLPLGPAHMSEHAIVDVAVADGQKVVTLRSNVTVGNELGFPIELSGVSRIEPGASYSVPLHYLRQRVFVKPASSVSSRPMTCKAASLGCCYDSLPELGGQSFVCTCPITESAADARHKEGATLTRADDFVIRASSQKYVYFVLRCSLSEKVGTPHILDSKISLVAPVSVTNQLGVPISITLLSQRVTPGTKLGLLGLSPDTYEYGVVTSATMNPGDVYGITELDPFGDICLDISLTQPNGGSLGRAKQFRPALIYSMNAPDKRHRQLTLQDDRGMKLVVNVEYMLNEVVLWCPFWIVNETSHMLRVLDSRDGQQAPPPIAGLGQYRDDGIPPNSSSPFLFNSEAAQRKVEDATLMVSVGRTETSSPGMMWSDLSTEAISISSLTDVGTVECRIPSRRGHVVSLAYSIALVSRSDGTGHSATRVITFTPRWVILNRCSRALLFGQVAPAATSAAASKVASSSAVGGSGGLIDVQPGSCHVMDTALEMPTVSDHQLETRLFVKYGSSADVYTSQWSSIFSIDTVGDSNMCNLRYECLVPMKDYWPQEYAAGAQPTALPPLDPDRIVEKESELFVRKGEADVISISCYRRSSVMYVVVSRAQQPPFTIENRTEYMMHVSQGRAGSKGSLTIFPKTTRPFAWEDTAGRARMVLWGSDGNEAKSTPLEIDFTPSNISAASREQFQQEMEVPGRDGRLLFVRVRGVHGTCYAVSITEEPTIDTYCILPYSQCQYQLKVKSVHTLFSDAEYADIMMLTAKPITLLYHQGVSAPSTSSATAPRRRASILSTDVQVISASVQTIQLDDERAEAQEKVVLQLSDRALTSLRVERHLLRTTPLVYCPSIDGTLAPVELHLEDSFMYDALAYGEVLKVAWHGGEKEKKRAFESGAASGCSWIKDAMEILNTPAVGSRGAGGPTSFSAGNIFFNRRVMIERVSLEKIILSISLYRSPGSKKDVMRQRFGIVSMLIRSTQDARLDWPAVNHQGVYGPIWMVSEAYGKRYKTRLMDQLPNMVNIAGFGAVRDLFSGPKEPLRVHSNSRTGLRHTAGFSKDKMLRAKSEASSPADSPSNSAASTYSRRVMVGQTPMRLRDVAQRFPWEVFARAATADETIHVGYIAVQNALRNGPAIPSLAKVRGESAGSRPQQLEQRCMRCPYVEEVRLKRWHEGRDGLPHPREGILTWAEFLHHSTWRDFVRVCTTEEVMRYRNDMKDAVVGTPYNVVRLA